MRAVSTLSRLHRLRQSLRLSLGPLQRPETGKEESSQYSIKATQAKALTRAMAEARDR